MLFILFHLGHDRYAIDAREIVEVLPLMAVKKLPQAPTGIAGVIIYRGSPIPAIDLSEMALGKPAGARLSTRIIIVNLREGTRLALIAERVTEMIKRESSDFAPAGATLVSAPYLGPITQDFGGIVQWIMPERLLSPEVRAAVMKQVEGGVHVS